MFLALAPGESRARVVMPIGSVPIRLHFRPRLRRSQKKINGPFLSFVIADGRNGHEVMLARRGVSSQLSVSNEPILPLDDLHDLVDIARARELGEGGVE